MSIEKTMKRTAQTEKEADAILKQLERLQAKVDKFYAKYKSGLCIAEGDDCMEMTEEDDRVFERTADKVHKILCLKRYL